jgi:hypothetical protein|mmetsp:Transcript_18368/g.33300  ORF Transcript_18368/g.33300 Transcript_18368/m.33300 type:complete len:143 (-) Transcript_18368:378-806(-)
MHYFSIDEITYRILLGVLFFLQTLTFDRQDNILTSAVLLNYGDEGVLPYYGYSDEILKTQVYVQNCVFQNNDLLSELLEATVSQVLPYSRLYMVLLPNAQILKLRFQLLHCRPLAVRLCKIISRQKHLFSTLVSLTVQVFLG